MRRGRSSPPHGPRTTSRGRMDASCSRRRARAGTSSATTPSAGTGSLRQPGDSSRRGAPVAVERKLRRQRGLRLVRTPTRRADALHAARVNVLLLLVPTAVLTMLGLVMVLSAGSVSATQGYDGNPFWYFQRQSIYALVGVVALLVAVRMPHTVWQKLAVPL